MSSPPGNPKPSNPEILPPTPDDRSEEVTATDLAVTPPEYLREMHDALKRAEHAYASGDLAQAVQCAEEGLAVIRLTEPKVGAEAVPPHYRAFFHAFRIQPQYRAALALFKQGVVQRDQPVSSATRSGIEDPFHQAWKILEPAVAPLPENLAAELLVYDYPVAGRVLRGALRLREKLRACLGCPSG
ncbi:MAG: hypothetical protein L0Z62_15825 [Gemmataceae bacterium]|nr:hypothetical protein [Gemmataceae bacterium]